MVPQDILDLIVNLTFLPLLYLGWATAVERCSISFKFSQVYLPMSNFPGFFVFVLQNNDRRWTCSYTKLLGDDGHRVDVALRQRTHFSFVVDTENQR